MKITLKNKHYDYISAHLPIGRTATVTHNKMRTAIGIGIALSNPQTEDDLVDINVEPDWISEAWRVLREVPSWRAHLNKEINTTLSTQIQAIVQSQNGGVVSQTEIWEYEEDGITVKKDENGDNIQATDENGNLLWKEEYTTERTLLNKMAALEEEEVKQQLSDLERGANYNKQP